MGQLFVNNAKSLLTAGVSAAATTLTLTSGTGDRFPVANVGANALPSTNDWFKLMLTDASGEVEVVSVRTRASGSDLLTDVLRARDGSEAREWSVGTVVFHALSAADFQAALAFALDREWDSIPVFAAGAAAGTKTATQDWRGRRINTDGNTITIPSGALVDGQLFTVYNNDTTARSLIQGAGVTLRGENGATGNRTMAPYALVAVYCVGANLYRVTGAGLS